MRFYLSFARLALALLGAAVAAIYAAWLWLGCSDVGHALGVLLGAAVAVQWIRPPDDELAIIRAIFNDRS